MQKSLVVWVILILLQIHVCFSQQILSDNASVSVLTVGPDNYLSAAFGHSGFRIKDIHNNIDVVYGYGGYDFDAPNFYLKFIQGKLDYEITKTPFKRFYQGCIYFDRTLKEQVLNLSKEQQQDLYNYLVVNYRPENRTYLYDFLFDNCATKIKDVCQVILYDSITFHKPKYFKNASYRTLIQNNLISNSWGSLGIHTVLGAVIDKQASFEDHMFLPEQIYQFFNVAQIKNNIPLVKESRNLYTQKYEKSTGSFLLSPWCVITILSVIILIITYKDFKSHKQTKWLDVILFFVTGIIGVVILFMWFATDHKTTHQNYNLLWAFVPNILMINQVVKHIKPDWFIRYMTFLIIMLCLLTLHWVLSVQVFSIVLLPFLVSLFARYLYIISSSKNRLLKKR